MERGRKIGSELRSGRPDASQCNGSQKESGEWGARGVGTGQGRSSHEATYLALDCIRQRKTWLATAMVPDRALDAVEWYRAYAQKLRP